MNSMIKILLHCHMFWFGSKIPIGPKALIWVIFLEDIESHFIRV